MLAALGVDVRVSRTFDAARRDIRAGGFDVLLSDLDLGDGRSALDLLRLLRAERHGPRIPAIVLSAYGSVEDRQASRAAGFDGHLVKPVDAATLARALADAAGGIDPTRRPAR